MGGGRRGGAEPARIKGSDLGVGPPFYQRCETSSGGAQLTPPKVAHTFDYTRKVISSLGELCKGPGPLNAVLFARMIFGPASSRP